MIATGKQKKENQVTHDTGNALRARWFHIYSSISRRDTLITKSFGAKHRGAFEIQKSRDYRCFCFYLLA